MLYAFNVASSCEDERSLIPIIVMVLGVSVYGIYQTLVN